MKYRRMPIEEESPVPVDVDEFYRVLGEVHGTYVRPGHWFEQDRRHMRSGLAAVSGSIRAALTI